LKTTDTLFDFPTGELLLVNKPLTWTSFDVVGKVRNAMRIKKIKVGHAGTLDPLASGLLIICTGKFTKRIEEYQATEKEYTGTLILGATTPSFDLETDIDLRFDISEITENMIYDVCKSFLGEIDQVSPNYSARRVDGERAYYKARRGEDFEIKSRKVIISEFKITKINLPEVEFRVVCSKGTYIRSLISDFGKKLNNGAYLSKLCRTRSGDLLLSDAWDLTELITKIHEQRREEKALQGIE